MVHMRILAAFVVIAVAGAAVGGLAETTDVTIKGVHLCCGGCVQGAQEALEEVEGITKVGADANTKVIAFQAADEKAMQAAFKALAEAGFHGDAYANKKPVKFPAAEIKKGTKSNSVTATGLHLCCGACKTGVKKAFEELEGAEVIEVDQEARSVTVKGTDIEVEAFFQALYKAGYHGEPKTEKSAAGR